MHVIIIAVIDFFNKGNIPTIQPIPGPYQMESL